MSQQSPIIGSGLSGLEYRNEDNDGKQALLNHHKSSSAPSYAEAGCIWLDDSSTPWLLKIYDGSSWLSLAEVNATNDTVNSVTTLLSTANEYTATQNFNATTLTDTSSIAWDLESNQVAIVTVTADRALSAPTNQTAGATYILIVKGEYALTFDSTYCFPSGEAPEFEGAVNILTFVSDGTYMYGVHQGDFQ